MKDTSAPLIEDGDDFSFQSSLKIGDIALEQYRRCLVEGSKDMIKGGKMTKVVSGKAIIIDVPNQRQVFINCVKSLRNMLTPFIKGEGLSINYEEKLKDYDDNLKDLDKTSREKYQTAPDKCTSFDGRKSAINTSQLNQLRDHIIDNSETTAVDIYRGILELFSKLLNDLDYFQDSGASS